LAGIALLLGAFGDVASADLVLNGGFETGDFTDWNYTSQDHYSYMGIDFPQSGKYGAVLGDFSGDGGGSISQSLATTAGTTYVLSFWFAGDGDPPSGFRAVVGGNRLFQVVDPPYDNNYNLYSFNFTATSPSTLLEFDEYDDEDSMYLDNVSVVPAAAVPEPAGMILLGIGSMTLAGYHVHRGRKSSDRTP
jgi:hypothetical protein